MCVLILEQEGWVSYNPVRPDRFDRQFLIAFLRRQATDENSIRKLESTRP